MIEWLTLFKRQWPAIAFGIGINREIMRVATDMNCVTATRRGAAPANMPVEQIDQHFRSMLRIANRQVHMFDDSVRHFFDPSHPESGLTPERYNLKLR